MISALKFIKWEDLVVNNAGFRKGSFKKETVKLKSEWMETQAYEGLGKFLKAERRADTKAWGRASVTTHWGRQRLYGQGPLNKGRIVQLNLESLGFEVW